MVRYLFYTIGDLTYQSPLVCKPEVFTNKTSISPVLPDRHWGPPTLLYNGTGVLPFSPNSGRYVTLVTYIFLHPTLRMRGAMPPFRTYVNDTAPNYLSTRESSPSCCKHFCPEQFLWTENLDDSLSCDGRTVGLFLIADWLHGRCHGWKSWIVNYCF